MLLRLRTSPQSGPRSDEKPSLEPADQPEPDKDEKTPNPTGRVRLVLRQRHLNRVKRTPPS